MFLNRQTVSVSAASYLPGSRCYSSTCRRWEEAFDCSSKSFSFSLSAWHSLSICIFIRVPFSCPPPSSRPLIFHCHPSLMLLPRLSPPGGWQHGRPSQQVLCHSSGPEAQARGHPGPGLHGAGAAHPVLQVNSLQAHQDHLLQGRSFRRPVQTGQRLLLFFFH